MKYKSYGLYTAKGIPLAVRGTFENVFLLEDIIEISKDGKDLVSRLKLIERCFRNPTWDRESDEVIRIKGNDFMGNIHYLKIIL